MNQPAEPTADQCNDNAEVFNTENKVGVAIWYPQMGGYVGKAVAVMDKHWTDNGKSRTGGCIDVYVWHDGEFPFKDCDGSPRELHHCDPMQFTEFGMKLTNLNNRGKEQP